MKDTLTDIIENYLSKGQVLIDLNNDRVNGFLKVTIDSEDGVTLEETVKLTKVLRKAEKMEEFFPNDYRLEVSTPGIEQPLKYPFQFKKNIDRKITIVYNDKNQDLKLSGRVIGVDNDSVNIKSKNKMITLAFDKIVSANINLSFK